MIHAALLQFADANMLNSSNQNLRLGPMLPAAKHSALVSDKEFGVCMSSVVCDIDWRLLERMDAIHRVISQPGNVALPARAQRCL